MARIASNELFKNRWLKWKGLIERNRLIQSTNLKMLELQSDELNWKLRKPTYPTTTITDDHDGGDESADGSFLYKCKSLSYVRDIQTLVSESGFTHCMCSRTKFPKKPSMAWNQIRDCFSLPPSLALSRCRTCVCRHGSFSNTFVFTLKSGFLGFMNWGLISWK